MFTLNDKKITMEDTQKIFVMGFRYLLEKENEERRNLGKKKITISHIAEKINVSPSNLSGFLNFHRNYSEDKREELSRAIGYNYIAILMVGNIFASRTGHNFSPLPMDAVEPLLDKNLSGEFPMPAMTATATNTQPPARYEPVDIQQGMRREHELLTHQFEDKEWAIELNRMLVEIERRNPAQKAALTAMIKGLYNALPAEEDLKKTGTENRQ